MISFINQRNATFVYIDNEGIDELISYLNYLKRENDYHFDLVVGNELEELPEDDKPEGECTDVTYVSLINLDRLK